jgi:hypothetical protein
MSFDDWVTVDSTTGVQSYGLLAVLTSTIDATVNQIEVQYSLASDHANAWAGGTFTPSQLQTIVLGLQPGTLYSIRARAVAGTRYSAWTTWVDVATAAASSLPVGAMPGLGDLAVLDNVNLGLNVNRSGGGPLIYDADVITSLGTASAITSQGTLATLSQVTLGTNVYRSSGPLVTDATAITSLGTAAAFTGQAAIATDTDAVNRILAMRGDNYARNGGFTEGNTGYTLAPNAIYAGLGAGWPAPSSILFQSGGLDANSYFYINNSATIPFTGSKIFVSFQAHVAAGSSVDVWLNFFDAAGSLVSGGAVHTTIPLAAIAAFTQYEIAVTVPAGVAGFNSYIIRNGSSAGNVYFTNIRYAATARGATVGSVFNSNTYRNDGTTLVTDALGITSLGTAAAIAGQGSFATLSAINSTLADSNNLLQRASGGIYTGDLAADLQLKLVSWGSATVTINGNTFKRNSGTDDFNATVYAQQETKGPQFVSALVINGGWTIISLDDDLAATGQNAMSAHVQYHNTASGGALNFYKDGTLVQAVTGIGDWAGRPLVLVYDNLFFRALVGGVERITPVQTTANRLFWPVWHSYSGGSLLFVAGCRAGPTRSVARLGDNTYDNGGALKVDAKSPSAHRAVCIGMTERRTSRTLSALPAWARPPRLQVKARLPPCQQSILRWPTPIICCGARPAVCSRVNSLRT